MQLEISDTLIYTVITLFFGFLAYLQIRQYQLLRSLGEKNRGSNHSWITQVLTGSGIEINIPRYLYYVFFFIYGMAIQFITSEAKAKRRRESSNIEDILKKANKLHSEIGKNKHAATYKVDNYKSSDNPTSIKINTGESCSCTPDCVPTNCGFKAEGAKSELNHLLKTLNKELENDPFSANTEAVNNLIALIKKTHDQPELSVVDQILRLKKKVSDITINHEDGIRIMTAFDDIVRRTTQIEVELQKIKRVQSKPQCSNSKN